jgi:hypothetical protein
MPDEHGRLTEADNDLIESWWGQHSQSLVICPVCNTTGWKIAEHIVNIQTPAVKAPTYPHIEVTCKFCAHSLFFNAVQIGIAAPQQAPPTQQSAGMAASDAKGGHSWT